MAGQQHDTPTPGCRHYEYCNVWDCPDSPTTADMGSPAAWTPEQHMANLRFAIEHVGIEHYPIVLARSREYIERTFSSHPATLRERLALLDRYYSVHI